MTLAPEACLGLACSALKAGRDCVRRETVLGVAFILASSGHFSLGYCSSSRVVLFT